MKLSSRFRKSIQSALFLSEIISGR